MWTGTQIEHAELFMSYEVFFDRDDPTRRFDRPLDKVGGTFVYLLDEEGSALSTLKDLSLVVHTHDGHWIHERSALLKSYAVQDTSKTWRQSISFAFGKPIVESSAPWRAMAKHPCEVFFVLRDARHDRVMPVEVTSGDVNLGAPDRPCPVPPPPGTDWRRLAHRKRFVRWKILQEVPRNESNPRWRVSA
jgi:hypothetical protein